MKELLKINDAEILSKKGIKKVKVIYKDKSTKEYDLDYWIAFKDGIIENLYNKKLCKINFIK